MKKRNFLVPVAVAATATLAVGAASEVKAATRPVASPIVAGSTGISTTVDDGFVLTPPTGQLIRTAMHYSHSSHVSHSSHSSHQSHYSSSF